MRRILILHNNNIPKSILNLCHEDMEGMSFHQIPISYPKGSIDSFDCFISRTLSREIDDKYDVIILPYSLNRDNVLTYDGIACGCFLRFDETFKNTRTPLLFLGPDQPMEIMKRDPVGGFLSCPGVVCSSTNTSEGLISFIGHNRTLGGDLDDVCYARTITHFSVPVPDNFGDSKHAVTNLWSLIRWHDMINWDSDNVPALSSDATEFRDSMYFKWSEAVLSTKNGTQREEWSERRKKKNPISPGIVSIQEKNILHIDDEGDKGWYSMFSAIFKKSKANYYPFTDFRQSEEKADLIQRLKAFIESVQDVDCYIIDLRLHEEDMKEKDFNLLTGHEIAKYIYSKNPGNQVILFSASEKIWNLKKSGHYITDYALKENPSRFFSREESYQLYAEFTRSVMTACRQSYLKQYSDMSKNYPTLRDFTLLLKMDLGMEQQVYIKPAALNLIVFIESFIKEHFEFKITDRPWIIFNKDTGEDLCDIRTILIKRDDIITDIKEQPSGLHPGWEELRSNDFGIIVAVLFKHYKIRKDMLLKVIALKDVRNTSIAHGGKDIDMKVSDLRNIFDNVVTTLIGQ